jgi:hypothetical protein
LEGECSASLQRGLAHSVEAGDVVDEVVASFGVVVPLFPSDHGSGGDADGFGDAAEADAGCLSNGSPFCRAWEPVVGVDLAVEGARGQAVVVGHESRLASPTRFPPDH